MSWRKLAEPNPQPEDDQAGGRVIAPSKEDRGEAVPRNADDAWAKVEAALDASEPAFDDWQDATAWVRCRSCGRVSEHVTNVRWRLSNACLPGRYA